ncbi:MAG: alpha/beta fold hydrolase [Anaerolineae bacterium]
MRKISLSGSRLIRVSAILIVLLLVALYIGLPTAMAIVAIVPDNNVAGSPPSGFALVELHTTDAVKLRAWYAEPQNGFVIILVHGSGGGRNTVRSYAEMLRDNGYGVLAVSMRGYEDSEGRINRLGWKGTFDIEAAVEYLLLQPAVRAIGALGFSMGGEILLGAASNCTAIQAIAVEGATSRDVNEFTSLPMNMPWYRNFTHRVFSFMVGIMSGDEMPPPLAESIVAAKNTSFLFIAAGNNGDEVAFNQFFYNSTSSRSAIWIVPNVDHTGGFSRDPKEYEQRIVGFFNTTLLGFGNSLDMGATP